MTGGSGYLGIHLGRALHMLGAHVNLFDLKPPTEDYHEDIRFHPVSSVVRLFKTTGVCRRQVKNVTKSSKLSKLLNFIAVFGTTMENASKISTNMPSIGLVKSCEITFEMVRILRN